MGFRFRKSIRIAPGIRLNVSKTGISTSLGGKGATVNVSKRGVRGTVGLPGSGLSYSTRLDRGMRKTRPMDAGVSENPRMGRGGKIVVWSIVILVVAMIIF